MNKITWGAREFINKALVNWSETSNKSNAAHRTAVMRQDYVRQKPRCAYAHKTESIYNQCRHEDFVCIIINIKCILILYIKVNLVWMCVIILLLLILM